jgi:hypothetical protein
MTNTVPNYAKFPTLIPSFYSGKKVAEISITYYSAYALMTDGTLYGLGDSYYTIDSTSNGFYGTFQLMTSRLSSYLVAGEKVTGVCGGVKSLGVRTSNGRALMMGDNANGNLGLNTATTPITTPTSVKISGVESTSVALLKLLPINGSPYGILVTGSCSSTVTTSPPASSPCCNAYGTLELNYTASIAVGSTGWTGTGYVIGSGSLPAVVTYATPSPTPTPTQTTSTATPTTQPPTTTKTPTTTVATAVPTTTKSPTTTASVMTTVAPTTQPATTATNSPTTSPTAIAPTTATSEPTTVALTTTEAPTNAPTTSLSPTTTETPTAPEPTSTTAPTTDLLTTDAPTTTETPTTEPPTTDAQTTTETPTQPSTSEEPTTTSEPSTASPTPAIPYQPLKVYYIANVESSLISIGSGFSTNDVYFKLSNSTDTVILQGTSTQDSTSQIYVNFPLLGYKIEVSNDTSFDTVAASTTVTEIPFYYDVFSPVLSKATLSCYGILATNSSVCGGVGTCSSDGTCNCGKLYSGQECEEFTCFGVPQSDANVCNKAGVCTALDTCSCTAGKYGLNCRYPTCFGLQMEDPTVCSSHGFCINTDQCLCSYGWSGQNCSVPICYNITANNPNVCWKRGVCTAPDTCVCTSPYSGNQCKSPAMSISSVSPSPVINYSQNLTISGSGFVQTTGVISCRLWKPDGQQFDTVEATLNSDTSLSCPVRIDATTNDVINVQLVRVGASQDDSDPSNTDTFVVINSVLASTDCGQVPGSIGCPDVTITDDGNMIVATALEEGRRSLQSTAKSNIYNMQGYVDFSIKTLTATHGSPLEFWFFDEVSTQSTYTSLEVGNKISLFYDTVGGGSYFDRVQEKCNFDVNTKYRLILKLYHVDSLNIINATLYTMPNYSQVCSVEQYPRSFDAKSFFARNYSMVLSASSNSEQQASAGDVTASSVELAVDVMVLECQPGKCKTASAPITIISAPPAEFPWLAVVVPTIIIIIIIVLAIAAIIIGVCVYYQMRKNVYVNEEMYIEEENIDDEAEEFNIEDDSERLDFDDQLFLKQK